MIEKCQECGKEIDPEYLPSNFCEDCVDSYMKKIKKVDERSRYCEDAI